MNMALYAAIALVVEALLFAGVVYDGRRWAAEEREERKHPRV